MYDSVTTHSFASRGNDPRYPRSLWFRILRWIAIHLGDLIEKQIVERWRRTLFICLIFYLLGTIYNTVVLVIHNHNTFSILTERQYAHSSVVVQPTTPARGTVSVVSSLVYHLDSISIFCIGISQRGGIRR